MHSHFFVVLNLNYPMRLLSNASPGSLLFLISVASFFIVITLGDLFLILELHLCVPLSLTLPSPHHILPCFIEADKILNDMYL